MKKYEEPEIEIQKFSMVDVITTSVGDDDVGPIPIPGEDVTPWG